MFGKLHRIGNKRHALGIGLFRHVAIGDIHIEIAQALGDIETDAAETHKTGLALRRVKPFWQPSFHPSPLFGTDPAARLAEHHSDAETDNVVGKYIGRVGDADTAFAAGVQIDRIISYPADRKNLRLGNLPISSAEAPGSPCVAIAVTCLASLAMKASRSLASSHRSSFELNHIPFRVGPDDEICGFISHSRVWFSIANVIDNIYVNVKEA